MARKVLGFFLMMIVLTAYIHGQDVTIDIHFSAVEKALKKDVFNQKGRYYISGNIQSKCDYAYLESPRIESSNNRLVIKAHFSGRKGKMMFKNCVGPGDSFDVAISGQPFYQNGTLGIRDIRIDRVKNNSIFYKALQSIIERQFPKHLDIALQEIMQDGLTKASENIPYLISLANFSIPRIHVYGNRLTLHPRFRIVLQ